MQYNISFACCCCCCSRASWLLLMLLLLLLLLLLLELLLIFVIVRGTQQTINTRMYFVHAHMRTRTHTCTHNDECIVRVPVCILTLNEIVRYDCFEIFAHRSRNLSSIRWNGIEKRTKIGATSFLNWMVLPPALVDVYPRPRSAIGYVPPYNHMQPESIWLLYVTALQGMVVPLKRKKNGKKIPM